MVILNTLPYSMFETPLSLLFHNKRVGKKTFLEILLCLLYSNTCTPEAGKIALNQLIQQEAGLGEAGDAGSGVAQEAIVDGSQEAHVSVNVA